VPRGRHEHAVTIAGRRGEWIRRDGDAPAAGGGWWNLLQAAVKARDALKSTGIRDETPNVSTESIFAVHAGQGRPQRAACDRQGEVKAAMRGEARRNEETYTTDYVATGRWNR